MNPLGIFDVVSVAIECVAEAFGRKPRKEAKRERVWFGVLYGLFLLAGLATVVWIVRSLYFAK